MSWHTPSTDLGSHICIKLINLVKQHPWIYLSSKEYIHNPRKTRTEINQIWQNIASEIGLSVEDCKRRWKGLKDVYAKIRKRRLQEGVLGIKAKKKWVYEDFMAFMKFPFEKPYQKALENFEEVDCSDWRLEDAESNDTGEDTLLDNGHHLTLHISKVGEIDLKNDDQERMEEGSIEYLELDLEVDSVPDTEAYSNIQSFRKDDSRENHTFERFTTQEHSGTFNTDKILQSRFRAIRPKPYIPNMLSKSKSLRNKNLRNSTSSTNPIVNVANVNPLSQIVVTNPETVPEAKNDDPVILASPDVELTSVAKESNDSVSSTSHAANKLVVSKPCSADVNKSESPLHLSSNKNYVSSVELFFQSMAQTVMNLPMRAQAEIKMEICKIVTKAEVQYSFSQSMSELKTHNSEGKKG